MIHQASAVLKIVKPQEPAPAPLIKVRECRHGLMMYFPHDMFIGRSLDVYGEYVEQELQLLLSLVKEGDIVVEAGSNIGCDTVALAKRVTNSGRVFAFEPQRIIYQMLCGNLSINAVWNVFATQAGLGAVAGVMQVPPVDYTQAKNFGGVALQADQGGESVHVVRLDDYRLTRLDLLKIDVEGMEIEVLQGAADTIRRLKPIIYCENDRKAKAEALVAYIEEIGYEWEKDTPPLFNPHNFRGVQENVFPNYHSLNMLCRPKAGVLA